MLEEQAWGEIKHLKQDIFQWTIVSRDSVDDEVVKYIRISTDKSMVDPFTYFYVMPNI